MRTLVDIQFIACMGPPGGGRNPVTPRYLRHFNLTWMTDYSQKSLEMIFVTIFQYFFQSFPDDVKAIGADVLRHRIMLTYEAEAENVRVEDVVQRVFDAVPIS